MNHRHVGADCFVSIGIGARAWDVNRRSGRLLSRNVLVDVGLSRGLVFEAGGSGVVPDDWVVLEASFESILVRSGRVH